MQTLNYIAVTLIVIGLIAYFTGFFGKKDPHPEQQTEPIDMQHWKTTPHVFNRIATEQDVKDGSAAYYIPEESNPTPYAEIDLPTCAILKDVEDGTEEPIIIIQAEVAEYLVDIGFRALIGYRSLSGEYGVCTLADVEVLSEPDERFR